ncbi:MAG: exonuclease SbcCD subunit D [Spirochaetaceae bacterium]|jgi:exonuclease SbcD|nr:exonuclease SbcCD subunit D [Spirochaetaceae bacterium]
MKFLHTADLHLGKILCEHSFIDDQKHILNELLKILGDTSYVALLIAGDVYDRSVPDTNAINLFSQFLADLSTTRPDLDLLILSGNHDSASRLGFGKEIFSRLKIHFVTKPEDMEKPIIITRHAQKAAFFLMPFFLRRTHYTGDTQSPFVDSALFLQEAQKKAREEGADWTVLGAHLFASGGAASDSERVFVGTAEQIDISRFACFDYIALGHLHRCQKIGALNAFYSGSPFAYSFSEANDEKVFLSVDLQPNDVQVQKIPVQPLRHLRQYEGLFKDLYDPSSLQDLRDDYLEFILRDPELVENAYARLRTKFPNLLSVNQSKALKKKQTTQIKRKRTESRSIVDDFKQFLSELYDTVDESQCDLFTEFLHKIEEEEEDI